MNYRLDADQSEMTVVFEIVLKQSMHTYSAIQAGIVATDIDFSLIPRPTVT